METQLSPFDITQYLDSEEAIAQYLTQVLEEGDTDAKNAPIRPPVTF